MRCRSAVGLLGALLLASCAARETARANQPAAVATHAYLVALRSDDAKQAYAMMTDELRRKTPFEDFAKRWVRQRKERLLTAQMLEEDLKGGHDLGEQATIDLSGGQTLTLSRQSGAWRMHAPLLSRVHAGSPHVAIEMFADALNARDYHAVLGVLSARRRNGLGRQVEQFVASLGKHLADPQHRVAFIGPHRAELLWIDGDRQYKIVLILEGDEWRVDDLHAVPAPETPEPEATDEQPAAKPATPAGL